MFVLQQYKIISDIFSNFGKRSKFFIKNVGMSVCPVCNAFAAKCVLTDLH